MSEKFNRREFLTLHWESSIGFLGNFLAPQMEIERNFFRPPGAVGELEFLTSCTRCSLCRDVCPEQSIRLFSLEDGAKLALTPYIDPNQIPCTLCKKCVDICPTDALNHEDFNARPYLGVANVQESTCLTSQQVMCDYCVRSCPTEGAIGLKDGKPFVSDEHCNGCGICVTNCISKNKAIFINRRN